MRTSAQVYQGPTSNKGDQENMNSLKRPGNSKLQLWRMQFKLHVCVFLTSYLPVDSSSGCSDLLIQNATLEFIVLSNKKKRHLLIYNSTMMEENYWFVLCCASISILLNTHKRKSLFFSKKKKMCLSGKSALTLNIFNSVSLVTSSLSNGCFSFTTVLHKVSRSPNSVLDTPLKEGACKDNIITICNVVEKLFLWVG